MGRGCRNCRYCMRKWPRNPEFEVCPCCREKTVLGPAIAMAQDEAEKLKREFDFGWWLLEHDRL